MSSKGLRPILQDEAAPPRPPPDESFVGPVVRGRQRPVPGARSLLRLSITIGVILAMVAVVVVASLGVYLSGRIQRVPVGGLSGNPVDELNVLVVGSDSREGFTAEELQALGTEAVEGRRTDTIFLMSVSGGRAAMLSFPRDLLVRHCDGTRGRINGAYASGGPTCLVKTVTELTGIGIDTYVEVNLFGFSRIVDALGGVPILLDRPLVDRLAGLDLPAGCVVLDGRRAVGFVRARHIDGDGDLGRVARQQRFLKELAKEVVSPHTLVNVPRLFRVAGAAGSSVTADRGLGPVDLVRLASAAEGLAGGGIATYTVPGSFARVGGADVIRLDEAAAEALFARFRDSSILRIPTPEEVAALTPADVRVAILNGAGIDGLAARGQQVLSSRGFPVTGVGNAEPVDRTVVRYPRGLEAAAQLVARQVPGARTEESRGVREVTLVLGPDAQLDTAPPSPPASTGTAAPPPSC